MKHTSLFCAVAIAAAMGTQALATVTTNDIASITFEEVSEGNEVYPVGPVGGFTGWTAQTEDQSEIIAAPLSSQDAVVGYTANKHLKLNTEGNELTWVPGTITEPKAIIEMQVRLVASDTAPTITSNDVHAAVYLHVSEPADPTTDGLYAYTSTGWDKLDTSAFNTNLATGSMVALRVIMDYTARQATYEGAFLEDAEAAAAAAPNYVTLGTKNMANANHAQSQGHLASISFKGTGGVDDLLVQQITETPSTATVTFELWSDLNNPTADETLQAQTIDTVAANSAVTASFQTDLTNQTLTWKLYDVTTTTTECTWLVIPTADLEGNYDVTMTNFGFEVDHSYVVKVIIGTIPEPSAYTGPVSGDLQILCAADETAYETASGADDFVPLSFTSIAIVDEIDENSGEPTGDKNIVAGFAATVIVSGESATATADFGVITSATLGGATTTLTGSVTATATGGTVTIPMPSSDALFIVGFTEAPAPAGE